MRELYILALFCLVASACSTNKSNDNKKVETASSEFVPFIEEFDQSLSAVVDPSSKVEIIAEGFDWSEGPLWIDGLGLLFSDIPPNKIFLWSESPSADQ